MNDSAFPAISVVSAILRSYSAVSAKRAVHRAARVGANWPRSLGVVMGTSVVMTTDRDGIGIFDKEIQQENHDEEDYDYD